jgi:tetratricopeptide (TPR) repeat protein
MNAALPAWWEAHRFRVGAAAVAAVALAASLSGLWNGFAYDDLFVVVENPAVHSLRAPWHFFAESYWGPARGEDALYRPLVVLAFSLQWAAGSGAAWVFHAVNIALAAVTAVLVLALLRQLLPAGPALAGAVLFAAHPVHVEAVANVVGQAELWVGAALVGALALYARDRRLGEVRPTTQGAILVLYALALAAKEHGIVLPALVVALELAGRQRSFAAAPSATAQLRGLVLALALVAVGYLALRQALLGVITGDSPYWGIRAFGLVERATVMLALVPEVVRLLLWPARLYADYSPGHTPILPTLGLAHLPGIAILGAVAAGLVFAWRRQAVLPLLAAAWFVIAWSPTSNIAFPSGVLLAERTLYLPSVAVALLVGWGATHAQHWPPAARGTMIASFLGLVGLGTVHSAVRTRVWTDNPTLFSTLAVEAPTNFRGRFALGEYYAGGGRWSVADTLFQQALALNPDQLPARLSYLQELVMHGRCDRALPIVQAVRREHPNSTQAMLTESLCLLERQRFSEARSSIRIALASGAASPLMRRLATVADSMLVVTDSVDARNRFWREGRAVERTGAPLRVTVHRQTLEQFRREQGMQGARRSASRGAGSMPSSKP